MVVEEQEGRADTETGVAEAGIATARAVYIFVVRAAFPEHAWVKVVSKGTWDRVFRYGYGGTFFSGLEMASGLYTARTFREALRWIYANKAVLIDIYIQPGAELQDLRETYRG